MQLEAQPRKAQGRCGKIAVDIIAKDMEGAHQRRRDQLTDLSASFAANRMRINTPALARPLAAMAP